MDLGAQIGQYLEYSVFCIYNYTMAKITILHNIFTNLTLRYVLGELKGIDNLQARNTKANLYGRKVI